MPGCELKLKIVKEGAVSKKKSKFEQQELPPNRVKQKEQPHKTFKKGINIANTKGGTDG